MVLRTFVPVLVLASRSGVAAGLSVASNTIAKRDASLTASLPAAVRLAQDSPCAPSAEHVLSELAPIHDSKDGSHLKFYIHDAGAFNMTDIMDCMFTKAGGTLGVDEMDDHAPPKMAEHMTDYWLLQLMRRHPSRTHNPDKADFFVLGAPLMSAYFASWTDGNCLDSSDYSKRVDAVSKELKQSKYWAKHGGRDHFFINTAPWQQLERTTQGDLFELLFNEGQVIYATADRKYRGLDLYARAIPVPYKAHYLLDKPEHSRSEGKRAVPITFHGDMGRGSGSRSIIPSLTELVPQASIRDKRVQSEDITMEDLSAAVRDTAMTYLNSSFCFVPSGDTPTSRRMFDALAAGCIPVVLATFGQLANTLPFRDIINWAEIAIFAGGLGCDDIDGMAQWLAALMKKRHSQEVKEVRQRGADAFRYLSYHSLDLVDAVMHDVQQHLQDLK